MKKKLLLAALVLTALAGCTSNDFVGDTPTTTAQNGTEGAISFGGEAGKLTRATSNTGTVARMLDHQFKVYGVKKGTSWSDVFVNYLVWDSQSTTTSNPDPASAGDQNGWEYVGVAGTYGAGSGSDGDNGSGVAISNAQYIKYWDYSTTNYHFVAGSPYANFTFNKATTGDNIGDITTATVTGIAGHIVANPTSGGGSAIPTNPVYIADPVNVDKADYNKEVVFNFRRQQAFVRVGVFETIPGYSITDIKFYTYGSSGWSASPHSTQNIILASATANYFQGASNATVTVTYNWTGTPSYTYAYGSGLTQDYNWYGGLMTGVPATASIGSTISDLYGTDLDMASATGYFTVIPSASSLTAQPILIKCDYTLKALDTEETIKVTGATAAIPAAFTYWKPNTSYTYLFKISDNTNGTTGTGSDEVGLHPITFDAVVIAESSGTEQGTITSVSTPSITTYQSGSVTTTGIKYVTGKAIYLTVANNTTGALNTLTDGGSAVGAVQVYKLSAAINADPAPTEADLQITPPTGTDMFTLASEDATVDNVTLPSGKHGSFTPTEAGFYAIQYLTTAAVADPATPAAYTYKIVKVVAP